MGQPIDGGELPFGQNSSCWIVKGLQHSKCDRRDRWTELTSSTIRPVLMSGCGGLLAPALSLGCDQDLHATSDGRVQAMALMQAPSTLRAGAAAQAVCHPICAAET